MTMQEMVNQLNIWAYEYYVLDNPSVSDVTYDALYDQLVQLEKDTGIILPDSPTQRVGGEPLKKFENYTHKQRLYSLDKVQSFDQLKSWVEKVQDKIGETEFSVELKYDGLTVNVTYKDGIFIQAVTRGNGVNGEVITKQVKTINSLPLKIDFKGEFEVQGEGIMALSVLEKYNQKHPDNPLKNARNAAAGALRNLDAKVTAERKLDLIFYSVGYNQEQIATSQSELVQFLKDNKFKTNKVFALCNSFEEIKQVIQSINDQRSSFDFLIDGAVVKVNHFAQREILGYTDKFPRWAVAFKFDAEQVATTLKQVDWQVGRTGKVTPIGILKPVELCGATIQRATLNNFDDILRKNLKVGAEVYIRRSNDVIPEVLGLASSNENSKEIEKPTLCPSCGTQLYQYGAHIFCPNALGCTPQIVARIAHYCSKSACDVEGLSDKTIAQLVDFGFISSFADLYTLTQDQLLKMDGFQQKKAENVIFAIKNAKKIPLDKFIFALGIDGIGSVTAKDLAKKFTTFEKVKNATFDQLLSIEGIGEIVADNVVRYFADTVNLSVIDKLFQNGVSVVNLEKKTGIFEGLKVVLTGSLTNYTRSQAGKLIEQNGGEIASSVSKNVNLVIAGQDAGSKLEKANKLGIKIIDENAFESMLKG
ncbi:MAG: NAD-dependent DNA ligase LigA [Clostridia bacterium]|nr:NAD-dependent DNA ligase LigA [Clostridia bacterium]